MAQANRKTTAQRTTWLPASLALLFLTATQPARAQTPAPADEAEASETAASPEAPPSHSTRLRWGLDGFGAASVLTGAPQTNFYQELGGAGGLGAHLALAPSLRLELEVQYIGFGPALVGRGGGALLPAGGLRFNPWVWSGRSLYLAAHVGYAATGARGRFAFDVAAGMEWSFGALRIGPTLRLVDVLSEATSYEQGGDARIVMLGLSIGFDVGVGVTASRRIAALAQTPAPPVEALGSVNGQVLDLRQQPLDGVLTVSPDGEGETRTLDASPAYSVSLPAGDYFIEAAAVGYLMRSQNVTVVAGRATRLDFRLSPVPKVQLAVLSQTEIEIKQAIRFAFNRAELLPTSSTTLDEIANILLHHRDLKIRIEGNADAIGEDNYNLELSQRRAEAVRAYLVGVGVPFSRLEAQGYGATRPRAPNDTEIGRAENRRVQFRIIHPMPGDDL